MFSWLVQVRLEWLTRLLPLFHHVGRKVAQYVGEASVKPMIGPWPIVHRKLALSWWSFRSGATSITIKSFIGESLFSKFNKIKKTKKVNAKSQSHKMSNQKVSESQNKSICPDPIYFFSFILFFTFLSFVWFFLGLLLFLFCLSFFWLFELLTFFCVFRFIYFFFDFFFDALSTFLT